MPCERRGQTTAWPYNRAVSGHDEDRAPAGTPGPGSALDDRRVAWGLIALLIAARVAAILWGLDHLPADEAGTGLGNDARRFHDITTTAGRPYRDFPVEIPPVAIGAIELLDPGSSRTLATNLALAMLACDLATAAMLGLTWGRRTALTYLVLGAPLAIFVYFRLDLLSVALAVAALVAARRGAQRTAGVTLAAATFTKVWPVVLLPLLAIHRRRRAVAYASGGMALGGLAWIWWGGWDGPVQVLTARHATGWEVESPIGVVVWVVTGEEPHFQGGAHRVGTVPPIVRAAVLLLLLALVAWIWIRSKDDPAVAESWGAVGAVAAVLVMSTILSHQYLTWLLPWAALTDSRAIRGWMFLAASCAAAMLLSASYASSVAVDATIGILVLRDIAVIAMLVLVVRRFARATVESH